MEAIDAAALGLRLVLGIVMLAHGIKHLRGREKTSRWFGSIGFKAPQLQWFLSTATEIGVGLLLVVGFGTSLAVMGTVAIMTVAFISVHRKAGFWITARPDEGYEYVLTLAVAGVALAAIGAGSWSIDAAIDIDGQAITVLLDEWVGIGLALLGIAAGIGQAIIFFRPGSVSAAGKRLSAG
jgi:putative oxidoreductase